MCILKISNVKNLSITCKQPIPFRIKKGLIAFENRSMCNEVFLDFLKYLKENIKKNIVFINSLVHNLFRIRTGLRNNYPKQYR